MSYRRDDTAVFEVGSSASKLVKVGYIMVRYSDKAGSSGHIYARPTHREVTLASAYTYQLRRLGVQIAPAECVVYVTEGFCV